MIKAKSKIIFFTGKDECVNKSAIIFNINTRIDMSEILTHNIEAPTIECYGLNMH